MGKRPINAKTIMQEKNEREKAKKYNQYVENKTPKPDLLKDMWGAFWVGGTICTIGQAFTKFYSARGFGEEEVLPWDTIDVGVSKKFLKLERKRAYAETVTPDCRHGCAGCGANCLLKEVECDA